MGNSKGEKEQMSGKKRNQSFSDNGEDARLVRSRGRKKKTKKRSERHWRKRLLDDVKDGILDKDDYGYFEL